MPESLLLGGRQWTIGRQIGEGGFSRVYYAVSDCTESAIKLVRKAPGAPRELLLAEDLAGVPNVLPVWATGDAGQDYALLMPLARMSLEERLEDSRAPVGQDEVLSILADMAKALASLTTVKRRYA